ncbi:MAG: elongation factor G [Deltaproteobacteria bacterium]|nr:elongation factor G [Deltaproteobacteria bacterium]
MDPVISRLRNLGISAHIDSGKTTLSERILFYTRRIRVMHEVKGKDGAGATMDFMDLERERGITITSAATQCEWDGHRINLIDTPGHVDFTIEVERALRVLDGAVLVLCAVGGVQSQSLTVDRQMNRYGVPRIAFVNKCDRTGANPARVAEQLRERLGHNAVAAQLPLGLEAGFEGVLDLVRMEAVRFAGEGGEQVVRGPIPDELLGECRARREELLDRASLHSEALTEAILEDRVTEELVHEAIRRGVLARKLTPVFVGSAFRNKGVQPLLDAVVRYLPSPGDVPAAARDVEGADAEVPLAADPERPLVALAFKLEEGRHGQLTYVRLYQGRLARGDQAVNARTGKRARIGRLVRMHAGRMEEIESAVAGDIVALFGVPCESGDTFCAEGVRWAMPAMQVPEPVMSLALAPKDHKSRDQLGKVLARFAKEDPTFRTHVDAESGTTVIRGMGELHLEVYVERMRREHGVEVTTGAPEVAYRETVGRRAEFDFLHKKQTGGSGQYARVIGTLEPCAEGDYEFVDELVGGTIPREYVPACDRGFREALQKGTLIGAPVVGVRVTLTDGAAHAVDSSDLAFRHAAIGAFREAYERAAPTALEPLMRVTAETPSEFQGAVLSGLQQRRGTIVGTDEDGLFCTVEAEVPLAEMFGYATALRSRTQGKAAFTMEFARYRAVPAKVAEELRRRYLEARRRGRGGPAGGRTDG